LHDDDDDDVDDDESDATLIDIKFCQSWPHIMAEKKQLA